MLKYFSMELSCFAFPRMVRSGLAGHFLFCFTFALLWTLSLCPGGPAIALQEETWPGLGLGWSLAPLPLQRSPSHPTFLCLQLVLSIAGGNFFSFCHPVALVPPGKMEEEELTGSLCPPRVAVLGPPGLSRDPCVPRALAQAPEVALSPWRGAWREAGDWLEFTVCLQFAGAV